jgi:hypothetical protein
MKFSLFEIEFRESRPSDKYGVYLVAGMTIVLAIILVNGIITGTHYG